MKILHVCSELYPLIKTGGLADVLGALPWAQQKLGHDVRVVLPLYPSICEQLEQVHVINEIDTFAGRVSVKYSIYNGLGIYLVDSPSCFDREGNPYHKENYEDYPDNFRRFALLSFIASALANGMDVWWGKVDILHAHDWQAGLSCAYLRYWQSTVRTVFTVHNLAYQGKFAEHHLEDIDLPWLMFNVEGLEFQGQLSYLKAGLYYSDYITTVSPTYADEITRNRYGCGLDGLLKTRANEGRLQGILNGIDHRVWHPKHDNLIAKNYDIDHLSNKNVNKKSLLKAFNLSYTNKVLTAVMVSRLTEQKGADIVLSAIDKIIDLPIQLIVLGTGVPYLEDSFKNVMAQYPKKVSVRIDYDEKLAHLMIAGGDLILVPSRFEPCGLTQLYGLKYGTLPLVRHSGGLADTVVNADSASVRDHNATGFVFEEASADAFAYAFARAHEYWQNPSQWQQIIAQAMAQDFSWEKSALAYITLYESIL